MMIKLFDGEKKYDCDVCGCEFIINSPRDLDEIDFPSCEGFFGYFMRKRAIATFCPQCNNAIFIKWL